MELQDGSEHLHRISPRLPPWEAGSREEAAVLAVADQEEFVRVVVARAGRASNTPGPDIHHPHMSGLDMDAPF